MIVCHYTDQYVHVKAENHQREQTGEYINKFPQDKFMFI